MKKILNSILFKRTIKYASFIVLIISIYFIWKDIYLEIYHSAIDFISNSPGLVVSICAIFLTLYESLRKRRHDRLSVKPKLVTYTVCVQGLELSYKLCNVGLGPAMIKNIEVRVDDELIVDTPSLHNAITKLNPQMFPFDIITMNLKDAVIESKSNINLIYTLEKLTKTHRNLIHPLLKRIKIKYNYSSIYGEEDIFDDRVIELENP